MKAHLKIVIFDGSFKTRPFINTVIESLCSKHQVYVLGFDSKIDHPIKGVKYVDLGTQTHRLNLIRRSIVFAIKNILKSNGIVAFFNVIKSILCFDSSGLKRQNFNSAIQSIQPDVVHVQWISLLPYCETILEERKFNLILSQLGYQLNVRPFVDDENKTYLAKWYLKVSGFHSVSEAIKANSDAIYSSDSKLDKVIYSGFNFNDFNELPPYIKSKELQLISVGRPHWIKGYDYMLKACRELKYQRVKFHYTIVGAAKNEELMYLIDHLELQNEVSITEAIPQKDVYTLMSNSSLLVLPSIAEGIANVVIEAMAIGLPVLSTRCGGVVELIDDELSGFLVPIRNPKAWCQKIQYFNELSLDKINTLRIKAREKVEKNHNINKMTADFESLYYESLTNKQSV